jgi:hypothetical protein
MANRKVKVIQITGEVKTINGVRKSDLGEQIEKALQGLYDSGLENITVQPEVKWDTAATGGNALLIVTHDESAKESKRGK